MDALSDFVWLEPKHLLRCKTLGGPEVRVSDTVSHFKNRVMKTLEGALRVEHRFAVAYSPWLNDTSERKMREEVRASKAILQEERRDIREWVDVVPAVQWALNTAYPERYASTPYHVLFGRAPLPSLLTLALSTRDRRRLESGCTR